jgi:hypothetical protein
VALTNRVIRFLDSIELDKWLITSKFIANRKDGRDTLVYEMLHRLLLELRKRRRAESIILQAMEDLADNAPSMSVGEIRSSLAGISSLMKVKHDKPGEVKEKPQKFNPAKVRELVRANAIHEINEKILKSLGFVLVLHYKLDDLGKEKPISATFEEVES